MDWPPASGWPKGFGAGLAALLAASLFGFHPLDPTLFSLLTPPGGARNWLGLPGAMVGGSLLEAFGTAALLLPLLVLQWSLLRVGRPRARIYAFHGAAALLGLSALHGLFGQPPLPGLAGPGLVGWAAAEGVRASTGLWLGAVLLLLGLAYSGSHLVYPVDWRRRRREGAAFLRYGWGQGADSSRAAAGVVTAMLLTAVFAAGRGTIAMAGAAAGLPGRTARRLREWLGARAPRPGRREAHGLGRTAAARSWTPGQPAGPQPATAAGGSSADGLDAWFGEAAGRPAPAAELPAATGPATARPEDDSPESPPESAGAAWQKAAKTYAENLDLDWEASVYRARQVRRSPTEWEEDDGQEDAG